MLLSILSADKYLFRIYLLNLFKSIQITIFFCSLSFIFVSNIAFAENSNSTNIANIQENAESKFNEQDNEAAVTLFNRNVVVFRTDLLGMSPRDRAHRASLVINEHLKNPGKFLVTTADNPAGTIVKIDDEAVFIVTNDDVDKSKGQTSQDLVKSSVSTLNQVILENRQSNDVEFMTSALIKTTIAVIAFLSLLWLSRRTKDAFTNWLLKFAHAQNISIGGAEEHLRSSIAWLVKHLVMALYWLLILLLTYELISFVLEQFPYSRAWGEQLDGYLLSVAAQIGSAILLAIPDLFIAFIIFMIARFMVQASNRLFNSVASGQTKLSWIEQDVASTTKRIVNVVVWLFAFVMAYPYLPGSGTEAFKGISVLVGLMLSLGASSLVSQAGSGLILTYTRTFRRGEYVAIGEHEGTVMELGLFTTRIRNGMGIELALPNAFILNAVTKNYSRTVNGAGFIVDATVTIGYDTPWRQVEAMLIEASTKTHGILLEPTPKVFQIALSDFYPEYRLVCQAIPADARQRAEVLSNLNANIQDVFNENGVQIMSPHYLSDPTTAKTVPENQWYKSPAKAPLKK
jgi:small-conductance mechanosensitive channel